MKLRAVIVALLTALFAAPALAHPFDDRAEVITEVTILDPQRARLRVMYQYEGALASFNEVRYFLDKDKDGFVTREERDLRFRTLIADLQPSVELRVGTPGGPSSVLTLAPDPSRYECIDLANADNTLFNPKGMNARNLRLGYTLAFFATLPKPLEIGRYAAEFSVINKRIRISTQHENMKVFDARGKDLMAVSPLTHDRTREGLPRVRFTWVVGLAGDPDLSNTGDPSVAAAPPPPGAETPVGTDQREEYLRRRKENPTSESRIEELFEALRGERADALAWALALLLAFGLGAWHALQPGHGKTLVAGYLIGTQGKKSDALFLGVVVTLAHTSGVLLLMGGAKVASLLWPDQMLNMERAVAEWIAVAVGATIFLMGIGLVLKRAQAKAGHAHDAFGRHLPGEEHGHGHDHGLSHGGPVPHQHNHRHADGTVHAHAHAHAMQVEGGVAVAEAESDDWLREHIEQPHDHEHTAAPVPPEDKLTRWQILRLGILGGVIPCPTAFVIALIAFQQQWYTAGLVMVLVFSLGLACVLSAIGLTLVVTKSYLQRRLKGPQSRAARFMRTKLPVIGALIITLIGFAMVLLSLVRLEVLDISKFAV